MKTPTKFLSLCSIVAVLISVSGCVNDYNSGYSKNSRSCPPIGSPAWIIWVDQRVDTRYSTGHRADPGSQEWYAIVDYQVFDRFYHTDYYPNGYYRDDSYRSNPDRYFDGYRNGYRGDLRSEYRGDLRSDNRGENRNDSVTDYNSDYRNDFRTGPPAEYLHRGERRSYYGPARFAGRDAGYRYYPKYRGHRSYRLGSIEWKTAVTNVILSGRIPRQAPRSDPWDAPLAPTH